MLLPNKIVKNDFMQLRNMFFHLPLVIFGSHGFGFIDSEIHTSMIHWRDVSDVCSLGKCVCFFLVIRFTCAKIMHYNTGILCSCSHKLYLNKTQSRSLKIRVSTSLLKYTVGQTAETEQVHRVKTTKSFGQIQVVSYKVQAAAVGFEH